MSDCRDAMSSLQKLYFTSFFGTVSWQHSLTLDYHRETIISLNYLSYLFAHDVRTYVHSNTNHHVGVDKLQLIDMGLKRVMRLTLGMKNLLQQMRMVTNQLKKINLYSTFLDDNYYLFLKVTHVTLT